VVYYRVKMHIISARENAAATLFSLSSVDEYKKLIGERGQKWFQP
jgi:hypothetical protein